MYFQVTNISKKKTKTKNKHLTVSTSSYMVNKDILPFLCHWLMSPNGTQLFCYVLFSFYHNLFPFIVKYDCVHVRWNVNCGLRLRLQTAKHSNFRVCIKIQLFKCSILWFFKRNMPLSEWEAFGRTSRMCILIYICIEMIIWCDHKNKKSNRMKIDYIRSTNRIYRQMILFFFFYKMHKCFVSTHNNSINVEAREMLSMLFI